MLYATYILIFLHLYLNCNCEIYNYQKAKGVTVKNFVLWPNATVPFFIVKEHFDRNQEIAILKALHTFAYHTCIKFAPVPSQPVGGLHILLFENPEGVRRCTHSPWASSTIEPHRVTLGYDCIKSPELEMMIMKSLGFIFEHNRPLRDKHVEVKPENVEQAYMELFARDLAVPNEWKNLAYDPHSVMHFGEYEYSKNGHRTIVIKDKTMQNRKGLTATDLKKIQLVYGEECMARDRKLKVDVCERYKTEVKLRNKRSIYVFPRKSLRVNPDITPPPMLDSAELNKLNITDVIKEITEHVHAVSGLIVKIARAKFCNVSKMMPIGETNNEKIKEAILQIEHHARSIIEEAQSKPEEFCADKPDLRACGLGNSGSAPCPIGFKSTKTGNVRFSTQHKPVMKQSTNVERLKDKVRLYHSNVRQGNLTEPADGKNNMTDTVPDKVESVRRKRDVEVNNDQNFGNIPEPSRRLVRKFRTKSTIITTTQYVEPETTTTTEATTTTMTFMTSQFVDEPKGVEDVKPKAAENDYEEEEREETPEIQTTPRTVFTTTTPPHQKRFKKKTVGRLALGNKEEDTINFNQHTPPPSLQQPQNLHPVVNKPKQQRIAPLKKKIKRTTTTTTAKVEEEPQEEEAESSGEEEEEEDAAGVKNVKVIMEYNTGGLKPQSPAMNQQPTNTEPDVYPVQQIADRQDDQDSGSDANVGVEEENGEESEESEGQPAVVIPEAQPETPSPEIFVKEFQPNPGLKKKKHKKEYKSYEEEEVEERPAKHKLKKAKIRNKPGKSIKTKIIGPGAPSYQAPSVSVPQTIRLNKKNMEFYNERKWNDAIVPFVIQQYKQYNTDDMRRRLNEVIKILKRRTCVRLQEVSAQDADDSFEDYLVIDTSPDYVTGRVGGKQHFGSVELFEGGQHKQHAAMMIMAMLGFYFEVARHDRDKYVRVHLRHVRADKLHHFEKIRDDATFPLPYDYKSATHPAWQFWRKLGKKGISTVATYKESDPSGTLMKTLGQNPELLSDYDIIKINTIYGVDCFQKSGLIRDAL